MNSRTNELLLYSGNDLLNKNISSYQSSLKTNQNLVDDSVRITHLYFKEDVIVNNLEEYRGYLAYYKESLKIHTYEFMSDDEMFCLTTRS